jgi:hypothetical protein
LGWFRPQVCSTSASGNSTFSLMLEPAGNANQNTYGVYDATLPAPPPYEVFPGHAASGWYAIVSFLATGDLVVNPFDATGNLVDHSVHPGVSAARVGFYLRGPGGTFHSEDVRNGGDAQALLYAGTGCGPPPRPGRGPGAFARGRTAEGHATHRARHAGRDRRARRGPGSCGTRVAAGTRLRPGTPAGAPVGETQARGHAIRGTPLAVPRQRTNGAEAAVETRLTRAAEETP